MSRQALLLGMCAWVLIVSGGTGCVKPTSLSNALQERADETMAAEVPGAYLMSTSTGGLALSDNPHEWTYLYYDPETKHTWRVFVHQGEEPEVEDLGESNAAVGERIPAADVKYSASEAIELARQRADLDGVAIPQNVQASGSCAPIEGGEAFGLVTGVWKVTFASDTGMSDAVTYTVDMKTGETTGPIAED